MTGASRLATTTGKRPRGAVSAVRSLATALGAAVAALAATLAMAAQFQRFGAFEVHFVAFNASRLSVEMAERYGIVRGPAKGLVNISAVGASGRGERMRVQGRFENLLGQSQPLTFREIDDAGTFYYLAAFDFPHAETLRFEVTVTLPGHGTETVRFQQPLYRWRAPADQGAEPVQAPAT